MSEQGTGNPPSVSGELSEAAVREQLARVLASLEFQRSPMLRDFLLFIVEKTLAGQAHEIKGYNVATQALGKNADFDADKDPAVRILAGRLRRALERYYLLQGKQDPIWIDIPLGAYVPKFQPAYQAMPAIAAPPPSPAGLVLPSGPSVAVMPLLNLRGDRSQDYFTDGLAEELTSELARYQDLRVIAFQSTQQWKGKELDLREVGRDLGVRFLVQGSVRRDGSAIKITVQLVDALNLQQLWSQQYLRELRPDSLIGLQEEIARQVAARLGSLYGIIPQTLSRESRQKPPETLETYEAFLRYHHHTTVMTLQTFSESLDVLKLAVKRDPESGVAWSLLAFLYGQNYVLQFIPMESPLETALNCAQQGVALEPENQVARAALALVYFLRNELELCLSEADTALALNPNAPAPLCFLGWLLALSGECERGLALMKKGKELNPHYPAWFRMAPFFHLFLQERYEEAYQEARAIHMPQLFWDPLLRTAVLGRLGREQEGTQAAAELLQLRPDFPAAGRFLISCLVKAPQLVEGLLEGLRQAGLPV